MRNRVCGECCHSEKTEHFSFRCKHCNGRVSTTNTACNHFSKRYGSCPECGSYRFSYEHTEDNDWQLCTCECCGCSGTPEEFLYGSVFARITSSLVALSKEFVEPYIRWGEDGHPETLWRSNFRELSGMLFDTKEEAISATGVRLKEQSN